MSSNTLLSKLFNASDMTPDEKAVYATSLIADDPSVLNKDVIAPTLSILYTSESQPLFDVLKEHGAHLDQTLGKSDTVKDYSDKVFLDSVPHC